MSRLRRVYPEPARPAPSPARAWAKRVLPLLDGVTYLISAGALIVVWVALELLHRLASAIGVGS